MREKTKSELRVNLEPRFDNRKGIYVLTYTGKPPYKIGMTNSVIGKRIGDYVNCPSQFDGHYIHLLLTWNINAELKAGLVESFIFRKLGNAERLNSTMRAKVKHTEHFDVNLATIKRVLKEAQQHYQRTNKIKMYLDAPTAKTVRGSVVKGAKNMAFNAVSKIKLKDKTQ